MKRETRNNNTNRTVWSNFAFLRSVTHPGHMEKIAVTLVDCKITAVTDWDIKKASVVVSLCLSKTEVFLWLSGLTSRVSIFPGSTNMSRQEGFGHGTYDKINKNQRWWKQSSRISMITFECINILWLIIYYRFQYQPGTSRRFRKS